MNRQDALVYTPRTQSPRCPIRQEGHDHSMGTCATAFQFRGFTLREQGHLIRCMVCFGPAQSCELGCPFVQKLSKNFFCPICTIVYPTKKPCTMLVCGIDAHHEQWRLKDYINDLRILFPDVTADKLCDPLPPRPAYVVNCED